MRVVFLTHYYPPEVGAPQVRISSLAHELARRGAEVTVHTGFPHYPGGTVHAPHRNRLLVREHHAGVRVIRSVVLPTANRGTWRRLADHTVFGAGALAVARASGPADVVVVETPPLFAAAAGVFYARVKRAPLVVNVADRWPASAVELGALTNERAIGVAAALERWIYRSAAAITTPTAGLVSDLSAEPATGRRVHHMPPSVDVEAFRPSARSNGGPLRVLYAGTVGMAHGLGTLVEAARIAGPDVVDVTIAGAGAESEQIANAAATTSNVKLLGTVPHASVPGLYGEADVAVVLLRDRPIFRAALPTKLLEALSTGCPVVLAGGGEAADLLASAGAGVVVPPEDETALAAAFRELSLNPGRRTELGRAGRLYAERHFDRSFAVERWDTLLRGLCSP